MRIRFISHLLACVFVLLAVTAAAEDPFPLWNDGPAKQAILDFVKTTTEKNNPKFVRPEDRIEAKNDPDGG